MDEFDIRAHSSRITARSLSGGNLQKLILAREVSRQHDILVAVQPTRGLDIGATEFVYNRLMDERDNGKAIILVSTELQEVISLSDRIVVMFEGRIVGEMPHDKADVSRIGLLMGGVSALVSPA